MQLWVIASDYDGKIPNDIEEIHYRLRDNTILQEDVNLLIEKGLLIECKQVLASASECFSETETETETDNISNFKFKKKVFLPENFYLTGHLKNYIIKVGCEDETHMDFLVKKFINHAGANGRKQEDWGKSFMNWVLQDKKKYNSDKYTKYESIE